MPESQAAGQARIRAEVGCRGDCFRRLRGLETESVFGKFFIAVWLGRAAATWQKGRIDGVRPFSFWVYSTSVNGIPAKDASGRPCFGRAFLFVGIGCDTAMLKLCLLSQTHPPLTARLLHGRGGFSLPVLAKAAVSAKLNMSSDRDNAPGCHAALLRLAAIFLPAFFTRSASS